VRLSTVTLAHNFWRHGCLHHCDLQAFGLLVVLEVADPILQGDELASLSPWILFATFIHHVPKRIALLLWPSFKGRVPASVGVALVEGRLGAV